MRILHISTSLSGGAGIAARRICEAQIDNGVDALILGGKTADRIEKHEHESIYEKTLLRKSISSFVTGVQQKLVQIDDKLVTPISVNSLNIQDEIFSGIDLLHIHAFYNMLSIRMIKKLSQSFPVVITLHDQRIFTGGCHYSFQCLGYESNCKRCPQVRIPLNFITELSLQNTLSVLKNSRNITYLAPSQWLANCASKSLLLQDKTINVIANPVPNAYRNLKIHKNKSSKLKIGFFSQDLNNPYKGINTLVSAAHILKDVMQIEIKFYGHGKVNQGMDVINYTTEHYKNDDSAVEAYNSCDVVVVPSTQDNSPSVISEALMCGVPVIGSDVGGIPEILNKFDLPTIEPNNPQLLANKLIDFVSKAPNLDLIRRANKLFSYKASCESHLKIYDSSLLNFKLNSVE